MINFRFHLISLVAVFLALGVGVAMGASFVDRATVDSLRNRVDDLGESYRRRGAELDATKDQLDQADGQAAALSGEASMALDQVLTNQAVVLIAADGAPADVLDATRASLAASGAVQSGTVRLLPALDLSDEGVLRRVRDRLDLKTAKVAEVRTRVVEDLGASMALLSGAAAGGPTTTTTTIAPAGGSATASSTTSGSTTTAVAPGTRPTDEASARAMLGTLSDLGLVAVDAGGAPAGSAFPGVTSPRFVMVAAPAPSDVARAAFLSLAGAIGNQAPAVLTVAESRATRPTGEATTTTEGQPAHGELLTDLRQGDLAGRVSTVDDLEESFGRIALVYAIAQQRDTQTVGHYGTGAGATAPFPTVPSR
jgi:hypothetical protein